MRILYVTTVGITMGFFKSFIRTLIDEGHTVEIATNETESKVADCYHEWDCFVHHIDCSRSPLNKGNLKAIKQIKDLVEKKHYDIVHCHTPIAAMCTRLACRKARTKGTRVFYTAHGFHFYKGAPLKNWLLYYPIEKICSRLTDVLITINQEDYALAQKKLKAKRVEYVPGVGIDLNRFSEILVDKATKRKELRVAENATLLLSVGELNENKNHETVIRAIADMDVYYVIAGNGNRQESLQALIDSLGLTERIRLLGYRIDVCELYKAADFFMFPSFREGLSVSVMEAMASGLPVVCSNIRGNTDLIDSNGGELFDPDSDSDCKNAISKLLKRDLNTVGGYNRCKIKKFAVENVNKIMTELYAMVV